MLVASLSLFIASLGFGVIVPLMPELTQVGTSAATSLSIIYAVYAATKIGAQIPAGAWVDRVGPRRVLVVGLSLFALSLAGFLLKGSVSYFVFVRSLEGLGTGLVYPAVFAWGLQGAEDKNTGKRIGLAIALGTSGLLLGPALGGLLAPHGVRVPVAVALGLTLIILPVVFTQRPPTQRAPAAPRTVRAELRGLAELAGNGAFLGLMLPVAFNKLTFSSFQGLLPLYGPTFLGLSVRGVTALFALTGVVFGAIQGVAGWLADRFAPRAVALWVTPFLLATLVGMAVLRHWLGFSVAYCGYIATSSIIFTATLKYAARSFGTEDTYGGVFGMLATLTDLMTIVGPLFFMNLYSWAARWVFAAMAIVGLGFAIGFWVWGKGGARGASRAAASNAQGLDLPSA